jgi:hypothetical protein
MAEHSTLTGSALHEPKGADNANISQVFITDGAGSGSWRYIPHSALYYDNIGTGTTITTPTAYTLIGPATVGDSDPHEFTHNSLGRLTYTGASDVDVNVNASITFKHSTGTGQDCYFQVHVNGVAVAGTQHVVTADSANYQNISLLSHTDLTTNDYVEVFCKSATGSVIVHAISINIEGKI